MADNMDLGSAKAAKKDEFYTQYSDIELEMNAYLDYNPDVFRGKTILMPCDDPEWSNFTKYFAQNFERFGIKKLISTSYAPDSKNIQSNYIPSLFETNAPQYDPSKTQTKGKIFILDGDHTGDGKIDVSDLQWEYLEGDGDFRSEEVTKLLLESDMVITNPPFSLFREFIAWIMAAKKQFSIIGNMNAITFREVFPLLKENAMWLGCSIHSGDREFRVPDEYPLLAAGWRVDEAGNKYLRVKGVRWYTNIEHGRRHQPLPLMTKADNLKFSKHKEIKNQKDYLHYVNFDAIDIPYTDAIPSDYEGNMGVPISFLDKYCPEQFEILGIDGGDMGASYGVSNNLTKAQCDQLFKEHKGFRKGKLCYRDTNNKLQVCYRRILIHKK